MPTSKCLRTIIAISLLSDLFQYAAANGCDEIKNVIEKLPIVEQRMGKPVLDYMGFGKNQTEPGDQKKAANIKYTTEKNNKCIGEVNQTHLLHGRGIEIHPHDIHIGFWNKGELATGKYITIYKSGWFIVGDKYGENGNLRDRFTMYRTDGSETKFDFK